MKFTLEIDCNNAAHIYLKDELARILEEVSDEVLNDELSGKIYDLNGNVVGFYQTKQND